MELTGNVNEINEAFVQYFHYALNDVSSSIDLSSLVAIHLPSLHIEEAGELVQIITDSEIKNALFDLNSSSIGGPDGFNSHFFKHT